MTDYLLAFVKPVAKRLTQPVILEVKRQVRHFLMAICLGATGVACVIVGLTYFAACLWHVLVPALGTVGADLVLGVAYGMVAVGLLAAAFGTVRQ